jgi:hypothetical protein
MALVAGAARIDITPETGVELMGYGARVGQALGVHDPLHARALFLRSETGPAALIVSADLCLMAPQQADEIRAAISAEARLRPEQVLVGCTHTHSGPDTGLGALMAGRPLPEHCAAVLGGLVRAGSAAVAAAEPAALGWSRAEAAIGRNRRTADGPVNAQILVLRVDRRDGRPLAVLFHHGCHGTVLGHDNLEISADWPGVAAARIEAETGAIALFSLGAHADIDPRTRGLMDLAIPGQSLGLGFEAVRVLGLEVAEATLSALDDIQVDDAAPVGARQRRVLLPLHLGGRTAARAGLLLDEAKARLAEQLGVAVAELPRMSKLQSFAEDRIRDLPLDAARQVLSATRLYVRDKTAPFFVGGRREVDVEAQVLRIGDAALLGLPLEPTTQVGLDWAQRAERRVGLAGVAGIANGWLRYLPHPEDLAHPQAEQHYEVLNSLLAPGACERLLEVGEALLAELS